MLIGRQIILSYSHESLIDFKDQQGFTPLMLACRAGKLDCALTLLQHGADFSILNAQVCLVSDT
jgi:ankyrin repeat protein